MKYVASCSFGKDSLAAIITRMEHGEPVDEAVYCRIMFDDDTSAELPEHEEWIHEHAIPLLQSRYGIKTTIVQGNRTYTDCFYSVFQKGKNQGRIYGWPFLKGPWCNTRLKTRPIIAWKKGAGELTQIVGIASDEEDRAGRKTVHGKILPLVITTSAKKTHSTSAEKQTSSPRLTTEGAQGWGAGFATTSA